MGWLAISPVGGNEVMSGFSAIIPCYHDEDKLVDLLGQLRNLPHDLFQGALEIIVVDGADSPSCRNICHRYDARWIAGEPCRGGQLLSGAALAQGDTLWF